MNKNKESKYEIIKKGKLLLKKIEQIDEIADIINANYKEWFDATVTIPEDTSHYAECIEVVAYRCAAALYEAGYRKVEKGE